MQTFEISRRGVCVGVAALAVAGVTGCGRSPADAAVSSNDPSRPSARPRTAAMMVYRDPSCGCCEAWAALAQKAGHHVSVIDHPDMPAVKKQYGVPDELSSCHTAIVAGYAIEGHVPLEDVERLLETKPAGIRGLAVPGMPRGSPGMEMPDGSRDPFEVLAFDETGRFARYGA